MKPEFRAWDKNNKEMISWRYLLNRHNLRNVFMRTEMCGLELMQYTGVKDKNGVEIFEGDIVRYTWDTLTEKGKKVRISKVFWSDWGIFIPTAPPEREIYASLFMLANEHGEYFDDQF